MLAAMTISILPPVSWSLRPTTASSTHSPRASDQTQTQTQWARALVSRHAADEVFATAQLATYTRRRNLLARSLQTYVDGDDAGQAVFNLLEVHARCRKRNA